LNEHPALCVFWTHGAGCFCVFKKTIANWKLSDCISIIRRILEIPLFQPLPFFFVFRNINSLNLEDNGACTVIAASKAAKKHPGNLSHPVQRSMI